ncbi:uncharacterized protein LOC105681517 [Bombus impatiens]|uniref:Uncharacterized protein LOC105681517 n=1 Tax=Bombus impatiens TaxID=132113 RepID=A0A6P3V3A4_BOMIM|nr:uncharacterized protein LOC105681517 [Bombus impatiens]
MSSKNTTVPTIHTIRVPPLKVQKIEFWFTLFERQLAAAGIKDDKEKANALLGCLELEHLEEVEDIILNPPDVGQYIRLKNELIRSLVESESQRARIRLEIEIMGDRKPSEFYNDLKILAGRFVPEQFVFTIWKNRLPDRIWRVLSVIQDLAVEKLIQVADRIEEVSSGNYQSTSGISPSRT